MVLAFVGFWGKDGLLNQLLLAMGAPYRFTYFYGWAPILLAHTFFNFPIFLKMAGKALVEMDRGTEMAALSLGSSRAACFFRITLEKAPAHSAKRIFLWRFCIHQ